MNQITTLIDFITSRNEVLAKVIFSQVSVIYSVHGGGSGPGGGFLQIFGGGGRFLQIFWGGSTFGRYASYWNAFLYVK